jgi:3-keto-L-gulonate-6-phosphate decarboxylase
VPVIFQISLDQPDLSQAIALGEIAVGAGVQVVEAGTGLIMVEGARHVLPRLKERFPAQRLVADIKCTDGGGFESAQMFDLGADAITVMASASDATIALTVREAAKRPGKMVMVDTMGAGGPDGTDIGGHVTAARRALDLGAHYVVVHLGYDERGSRPAMVDDNLLLRWAGAVVAADLGIAVQVVGGLTLAQAKLLPRMGIRDVVISMNLGSRPIGEQRYDQLTGFTVNLDDLIDRAAVGEQLVRFIQEVEGQGGG